MVPDMAKDIIEHIFPAVVRTSSML